jgi:hypothetical protein
MGFCSIKNRERTIPKIDLEVKRERGREKERVGLDHSEKQKKKNGKNRRKLLNVTF